MKLKPVQTQPAALLKGRVSGELQIALTAYAAYYCETTGQMIDLWPLVVPILQFLGADRDFHAWRGRTQNGPGAGPAKG